MDAAVVVHARRTDPGYCYSSDGLDGLVRLDADVDPYTPT